MTFGSSADQATPRIVIPGVLGEQLKSAYGALLNAPVPEKILDLIKKLEASESKSETKKEPLEPVVEALQDGEETQ